MLDSLNLRHAPFTWMPVFLGQGRAIDAAAIATISAHQHWARGDNASAAQWTRDNVRAVRALQERLSTDDASLASVSLLLFSEKLLGADPWFDNAHFGGLRAILEARAQAGEFGTLARLIATVWVATEFWRSCQLGEAASWDSERWKNVYYGPSSQRIGLQDAIFSLFVRLPRLIAGSRCCFHLGDPRHSPAELDGVITLADELLQLQNPIVESRLLHRVAVVTTPDPSKRAIMPYEYRFTSQDARVDLMKYWKLRLLLIRLRLKLDRLRLVQLASCADGNNTPTGSATSCAECAALSEEQARLAANVLMACPANVTGFANPKSWTLALAAVWGMLADQETFRGKPASVFQAWIVWRFEELCGKACRDGHRRMLANTAELLAGGPLSPVPRGGRTKGDGLKSRTMLDGAPCTWS